MEFCQKGDEQSGILKNMGQLNGQLSDDMHNYGLIFNLNSFRGDYFRPQRGLCQGDLLSLYLFILCIEALSSMIYNAKSRKEIMRLRICRFAPMITHLFFVDDSLFSSKAIKRVY